MTKWHGVIGYIQTQETAPGVFSEVATEYEYSGDVIRNTRRWEQGTGLNDNLTISNQFSIIGDWFSYDNFQSMRYLKWMGASWKILSVELQRPRLLVSVGGVYNG
jgi:hypothetical protein